MQRKHFLKMAVTANLGLLLNTSSVFSNNYFKRSTVQTMANVQYFKKGDAEYEILRKGFNKRIEKFPLVVALCHNTAGVAEAIQYAQKNNLPVAVKSGGHCMEGFSCNDGGMVINLSLLNTVEWVDKETINVGPGCTLSGLYDVLLPKGRIIPGGSCASVGIGGLVLGGGYGLLGRKLGLTCDSLLEVTMVDGNGQIINSNNDPELLWACKGGGNGNFGVVTQLKFKTHQAPTTMESYRFKTYKVTADNAKTILQKWFEVVPTLPVDCFSAFVLNGKTAYILLTNVGKQQPEMKNAIAALSAVSGKTTRTKAQPLATALKVFYGRKEPLYFKNASAGLYKNFEEISTFIGNVIDVVITTPGMIYQVNSLGGNIQNAALENTAAFPHRGFTYFSELQTYWESEQQSGKLLKKFQQVQDIFMSNGISTQYRNYPDINFTNWDHLYYGNNYNRLQRVKNKYDPKNIVRHDQSIKNV